MPSVRFPINVNLESIDGDVDRGKIANGYAEVVGQEVKVYSRPALTLAQGSFAAFGQGMAYQPTGELFVISGGEVYYPVGGVTASPTGGTHTAGAEVLFRTKGGYIYGISKTANGVVLRAASPYTSFSTIGTHTSGGALADAIVHNGTFFTIDASGTAGMMKSVSGTSWTAPANIPSGAMARLFSLGGTLAAYPIALTSGIDFYYTADGGASAWTLGTIVNSGAVLRNWVTASHDSKVWAIHGTGMDDVLYSSDLKTWTTANALPGWGTMTSLSMGGVAASRSGVLYDTVFSGTSYQVWASPNNGVSFSQVGSFTLGSTDGLLQTLTVGSDIYVIAATSGLTYAVIKLDDAGTLTNITSLASITFDADEMASMAVSASGVTFVKSENAAYTISSGTVTQVSDAQYPATTVRGAVYLNGRLYVMEPDGTIWNSAEDDFTSWAGTDFITAEFEADGGVCLAKQGEYVVALGQFTTEAFYDAGNATGSPLSPVQNAVMLIGCAHANSVAQTETSLMWIAQQKGEGSTFNKGRFAVVMQGYGNYQRISTPDVERVLDADDFSQVYAAVLTVAGHVFYVISLLDTDTTLAYDFRSQLWYEWTLATVGSAKSVTSITQTGGVATATCANHGFSDGDQVTIAGANQAGYNLTVNVNVTGASTFTYPVDSATVSPATGTITATGYSYGALDISASCYFNNEQLVQLRTTGDVYVLDVTGTSDNGTPIDFRIRTRNWDAGTAREKFQGSLDVVGDKVSSTGLVRYSDDDFQTYTSFKRVNLSLRRPRVRRGGSFSKRAVEFRHTLSAKVGISALEGEIEMGEQ